MNRIVRSAAGSVFLAPRGLVAPVKSKMISKRRIRKDWRLDLKTLVWMLAITISGGYVIANWDELAAKFSSPISYQYDKFTSLIERGVVALERDANNGTPRRP
ncbi:MAG: hypothetical protein PHE24_01255 [Patescibacteria group bacterium]|nr:hypothetical protein [Patescibacteria group bacterium]